MTDESRTILMTQMLACPHYIMVPEHYRDNGECRCDDPTHKVMVEWGYEWNERQARWI